MKMDTNEVMMELPPNNMESTYYNLNDPRLPTDVIQLYDAKEQVTNETLEETIDLAMKNGYFLVEHTADGYKLEKLTCEEAR